MEMLVDVCALAVMDIECVCFGGHGHSNTFCGSLSLLHISADSIVHDFNVATLFDRLSLIEQIGSSIVA